MQKSEAVRLVSAISSPLISKTDIARQLGICLGTLYNRCPRSVLIGKKYFSREEVIKILCEYF